MDAMCPLGLSAVWNVIPPVVTLVFRPHRRSAIREVGTTPPLSTKTYRKTCVRFPRMRLHIPCHDGLPLLQYQLHPCSDAMTPVVGVAFHYELLARKHR